MNEWMGPSQRHLTLLLLGTQRPEVEEEINLKNAREHNAERERERERERELCVCVLNVMILFLLLTMYSAPSFTEYSAILELLLCQVPVGRTDTQALGDITIITFLLHPFQLAYYARLLCTHRATDKDGHCGVNGTDMTSF